MGNSRAKAFAERFKREQEIFWTQTYPAMTREEKIQFWLTNTYASMRWQGESVADKYTAFSKDWYDAAKEDEPDFDAIFAEAVKGLGFKFDWAEYNRRISS